MSQEYGAGQFIADTTDITNNEAGPFVPELWSNEILATYKANLVLAALVTEMDHVGKKGDTVNIPTPDRGAANLKVAETQVTPNVLNSNLTAVLINKHFEYSTLVEDFADLQALGSMRKFLTDDAGYALARRVDWDLHLLARGTPSLTPAPGATVAGSEYTDAVIGGDGSTAWDETASANAGNASSLTDAGIRAMIQTLDDANTPLTGRAFVVPPVEKNSLLGISRFTEQAFTGEAGGSNSIRNGLIGDLYGNPFYVSTNCAVVDDAGSTADQRAGIYLHKDAWVLIMQQRMRAQAQYLQQYLATLFTSDLVYGVKEVRASSVVPFIVPA
jgi:hypothetical protein